MEGVVYNMRLFIRLINYHVLVRKYNITISYIIYEGS